jgi:DNA-binding NtrC family response regulator/tetratricopeptide (TPR) repeat protein
MSPFCGSWAIQAIPSHCGQKKRSRCSRQTTALAFGALTVPARSPQPLAVDGRSTFDVFAPVSADGAGDGRGFLSLDAILRRPDASGIVFVHGAAPVLDAVAAHAARRGRGAGRAVLSVGRGPTDDAVRELAAQILGVAPTDPFSAAEGIAKGLAGTVAVVVDRSPSVWGAAVLDALASSIPTDGENAPLVLVLSAAAPRGHGALQVRGALGPEETRAFWEAVALDADRTLSSRFTRIDALERWWSAARSTRADAPADRGALSAGALRLLARIALSERAWHPGDLARLGGGAARDELLGAGAIEVGPRGQAVSIAASWEGVAPATTDDAIAVAEVLERGVAPLHGEPRHDGDPWAVLRAAELYARGGDAARAEAAATRAILSAADADARSDFWQRWQRAQAFLPGDGSVPRLLRSAELALRVGDADRALEIARSAASLAGNSYDATLILGRAMAARGDLTTATLALTRAMDLAGSSALRARAAVEMAEVHYVTGQIDDARRLAEGALADGGDPATRLKARNVLGKLLLDNARWAEAESHFASDAWEAACSGDALAELRARLNRAIALMSSDRRDEARTMLASVLADGEAQGQLRAVCFALANLSIIALWKHEYADALALSERSIVFARRLGDKILLAHLITNLAELRLFFGLVAEADQALAFGRKACGALVVSKLASHFALAAARIHLARSRTLEAASEIKTALGTAEGSPTGGHLGRCHRLAVRIALEDGDVGRASEAMEKARQTSTNTKDRSEAMLLEAMLGRATGKPYADFAAESLALAGQSDNRTVGIEAHVLLCQAALSEGDPGTARSHVGMAAALRNRIAEALPDELRKRFVALREFAELNKLEASFERGDLSVGPNTLRSTDPGEDAAEAAVLIPPARGSGSVPPPSGRKIVGRDPSIIALLSAVQKIGPALATVLIHGESGTGKELVAEAIHQASPRKSGPLVKVNCAALVETLLLSELFGHEKGAFTGAVARRRGRFEMAEGGTLFLDEIGDISPRTQVALLRVLQERTFERVGGVTPIRSNARVVCATHRDLKAMVARGEFREDLYFRLTGVVLEVPALRQRMSDLPLIADAILGRIGAERGAPPKRLSPAALQGLLRHRWPGNVRELENALRAASLFAEGDAIEISDLVANVDSLRGIDVQAEIAAASRDDRSSAPPAPPSLGGAARPSNTSIAITSPPGATSGTIPATDGSETGETSADPSMDARGDASDPTEVAYVHIRSGVSLHDLKRNIERECIQRALSESKGNITKAAALLGMKRPRLSQLVKQYGFGGVSEEET